VVTRLGDIQKRRVGETYCSWVAKKGGVCVSLYHGGEGEISRYWLMRGKMPSLWAAPTPFLQEYKDIIVWKGGKRKDARWWNQGWS